MRVGVYAIMYDNNNNILLSRYVDGVHKGQWNFPAGHIDGNETAREALRRELFEELGITIKNIDDIKLVHTLHRQGTVEYIDLFFWVDGWQGTPEIKEPEKCDGLEWFSIFDFPENTVPYIKLSLEDYSYSEFGWLKSENTD